MTKNANVICESSLFSLVLISEWCGKIYRDRDYKGWEHVLIEDVYVAYFMDSPTAWKNDQVSSAKVKDGCTLKLYRHSHHGRFVETYSIVFYLRDHSSITSAKRWVGGVRKWQFLLIYSTIHA